MKALVQRVEEASVRVEGEVVGEIGRGLLLFVGVEQGDHERIADRMVKKVLALRIFEDGQGKMNLSLNDVQGGLLVVSQFTLAAEVWQGNRPSFVGAMEPMGARRLFEYCVQQWHNVLGPRLQTGQFAADMKVALVNDGPVTIFLDTATGPSSMT